MYETSSMCFFQDNSQSIGYTPLVRLNKVCGVGSDALILAKIEGRNPAYSVKCRIGASMIGHALGGGDLTKDMEVIEPTSGNTGIALAMACAPHGIPVNLVMPDTMSLERRKVLKAFGANLILTDGTKGMKGAIARAEEIAQSDPQRYFMPQQFKNPANPLVHETTTGPEIWNDTHGGVDVLVAGVGTGGTITGVSRYFKKTMQSTRFRSIAVEPLHSPVITQRITGLELKPGPHKIQGLGAGFIPDNLDLSLLDQVVPVTNDESIEMARRLAREEGILCGISSGAAVSAVERIIRSDPSEYRGKMIVVVLPDSGERYLSSVLFEGIV